MTIIDGVPFLASPNHTAGRQGSAITDIVLHWMDGTLAATDAHFANPGSHVSAHYGIENGTIHQYVALADTAWHAGDWQENTHSIGIEHSAAPGRDATPATVAASVATNVALCRKYGIDPSHIYPHNRFFNTACPGTIPLAAIVAAVRTLLRTPPVVDPGKKDPKVTWGVQHAIHLPTDSIWRQGTQDGGNAVIWRMTVKYGTKYVQARVGAVQDGDWGPISEALRIKAIAGIQSAIGVFPDGAFGPVSANAWTQASKANFVGK